VNECSNVIVASLNAIRCPMSNEWSMSNDSVMIVIELVCIFEKCNLIVQIRFNA